MGKVFKYQNLYLKKFIPVFFNTLKSSKKTKMGLLNKVWNRKSNVIEDVQNLGFEIAECEPDDCNGCSEKFPSSMTIDTDTPLWKSTSPYALQILVATGKQDWPHSPADEDNTVSKVLDKRLEKFEKIVGGSVKLQATSSSPPDEYFEVADETNRPTFVYLLPYFITLITTPSTAVEDLTRVIKAYEKGELNPKEPKADKLPTSLNFTNNLAYILICSHRTRDKRCGITAPILKKTFERELRNHDIYRDPSDDRPDGVNIHFVSHVGGHKFAANVIIYLKTGEVIWLARVKPDHVEQIVEKTILQKQVFPDLLRVAFKTPATVW